MTHLDTNFLIGTLVRGSAEDRAFQQWIRSGESIAVSVIVWAEFLCGPVNPNHVDLLARLVGQPIAFLPEDAELAARLFNISGRNRGSLADCMIAAMAIRQGATLATSNVSDFRRFQHHGLRMIAIYCSHMVL